MRQITVIFGFAALICLWNQGVASNPIRAAERANLEQLLMAGLEARTPPQRKYVKGIAARVKQGSLPLPLVMKSFQYVRKNYPFDNRKVVLFQQTLQRAAKKDGVDL